MAKEVDTTLEWDIAHSTISKNIYNNNQMSFHNPQKEYPSNIQQCNFFFFQNQGSKNLVSYQICRMNNHISMRCCGRSYQFFEGEESQKVVVALTIFNGKQLDPYALATWLENLVNSKTKITRLGTIMSF